MFRVYPSIFHKGVANYRLQNFLDGQAATFQIEGGRMEILLHHKKLCCAGCPLSRITAVATQVLKHDFLKLYTEML